MATFFYEQTCPLPIKKEKEKLPYSFVLYPLTSWSTSHKKCLRIVLFIGMFENISCFSLKGKKCTPVYDMIGQQVCMGDHKVHCLLNVDSIFFFS